MKKILLILSAALMAAGLALAGLGLARGGLPDESTAITHEVEGVFSDILVETSDVAVIFRVSEDGRTYAVCDETEHITYMLTVEDGALALREQDTRTWLDFIGIRFGRREAVLYLPAAAYETLTVKGVSGNVECTEGALSFSSVSLAASSGNVRFSGTVTGAVSVELLSGKVSVFDSTVGSLALTLTSGSTELNGVTVAAALTAEAESGGITLTDCTAEEISLTVSSGAVKMENSTARGTLTARTESGNITFTRTDGAELSFEATSGNVKGSLRSGKIFDVRAASGNVDFPDSDKDGGRCTVRTSSGNIDISIEP